MDSSTGNGLPWASVFDSTANMRALTAIQAEGLRAASKLVDRFIVAAADSMNTRGGTDGTRSTLSADQRADLWGATDIEPLLKSWWSMVSRLGGNLDDPTGESQSPTLEFADDAATGRLDLQAEAGTVTTAEIWINNRGAADVEDVTLSVSALQSDTGNVLGAEQLTLTPARVPLPARSGRGIELQIVVHAGTAPGLYRGNLFTGGRPGLWLPVVLTVREPTA